MDAFKVEHSINMDMKLFQVLNLGVLLKRESCSREIQLDHLQRLVGDDFLQFKQ